MVGHIKAHYGLKYVYCWHGLPAYWAGVMPGAPEMEEHSPQLVAAQPTPGEARPSRLRWPPWPCAAHARCISTSSQQLFKWRPRPFKSSIHLLRQLCHNP